MSETTASGTSFGGIVQMRNTAEQRDEEIDTRARSIAESLPCDSYECADRLWCIQRGICKMEQGEPCEEYPDNGPTDPWETSGPGRSEISHG